MSLNLAKENEKASHYQIECQHSLGPHNLITLADTRGQAQLLSSFGPRWEVVMNKTDYKAARFANSHNNV